MRQFLALCKPHAGETRKFLLEGEKRWDGARCEKSKIQATTGVSRQRYDIHPAEAPMKTTTLLRIAATLALLAIPPARADGLIIIHPPFDRPPPDSWRPPTVPHGHFSFAPLEVTITA